MTRTDPSPNHRLSLVAIQEAASLIDPVFLASPLIARDDLSLRLRCDLVLKDETRNPIRSFKGRGADYFIQKVIERGEATAMVCASTGNFGQAMAFACEKHSLPLTVFADLGANPVKLDRVRSLGAEVRLEGNDFDEAKERGKEFAERCNAWFVEDGREPEISEGAGTIAVELLAGQEEYDVFLIPLGNGALLTGNARWIKANSNAKVIGVSADGADSMEKSWRSGNIVQRDRVDTISEGIAVRVPVPEAVADMAGIVDEVLLVSDQRTIQAMRIIHEHTDVAVEPAAAVGVAAILDWPEAFAGQRVATILTGSNLTKDQAGSWLS